MATALQTAPVPSSPVDEIPRLVARMRETFDAGRTRPLEWRKQQLEALLAFANERGDELVAALRADLGKPELEARTADLGQIPQEAKRALKNLRKWTRPEGAGRVPLMGRSLVIREPLTREEARAQLVRYLSWYWEGVHRPLLLLPKASYAYALKQHQGGRADPMRAARGEWNGNSFMEIPGDKDDPYVQLVMRGVSGDPLESDSFAALAVEFYERALSRGELR